MGRAPGARDDHGMVDVVLLFRVWIDLAIRRGHRQATLTEHPRVSHRPPVAHQVAASGGPGLHR